MFKKTKMRSWTFNKTLKWENEVMSKTERNVVISDLCCFICWDENYLKQQPTTTSIVISFHQELNPSQILCEIFLPREPQI